MSKLCAAALFHIKLKMILTFNCESLRCGFLRHFAEHFIGRKEAEGELTTHNYRCLIAQARNKDVVIFWGYPSKDDIPKIAQHGHER